MRTILCQSYKKLSCHHPHQCFIRKKCHQVVAYILNNVHRYAPLNISPTEFGWILKDVGEQMPDPVENAIDDLADGDM